MRLKKVVRMQQTRMITHAELMTLKVMASVAEQSRMFNEANKCEVVSILGFEAETDLKEVA